LIEFARGLVALHQQVAHRGLDPLALGGQLVAGRGLVLDLLHDVELGVLQRGDASAQVFDLVEHRLQRLGRDHSRIDLLLIAHQTGARRSQIDLNPLLLGLGVSPAGLSGNDLLTQFGAGSLQFGELGVFGKGRAAVAQPGDLGIQFGDLQQCALRTGISLHR